MKVFEALRKEVLSFQKKYAKTSATQWNCIDALNKGRFSACKNILLLIIENEDDNDINTLINTLVRNYHKVIESQKEYKLETYMSYYRQGEIQAYGNAIEEIEILIDEDIDY